MNTISEAPTTSFNSQTKRWTQWFICVLSLAGLIYSRPTASAGCYCMMESMSVFANYNKTGFAECQASTPAKLFLVSKKVTSDSGGAVSSDGYSVTWADYEIQTDTFDPKTILPGGDPSYACRTWTLGSSYTDYSGNSGDVIDGDGAVSWQENDSTISNTGTNGATQTNSCNGWWQDSGSGETGDICVDLGPVYNIIPDGYFDGVTVDEDVPTCTSTVTEARRTDSENVSSTDPGTGVVYTYTQHDSFDTITTLSQEFTDAMLPPQIKAWLTNWPATWGGGTGFAYYNFNDQNHFCAYGGKFKYRVKVPDSDQGTTYVLHWQEITLAADGTLTTAVDQQEQIQGTGDPENPATGTIHNVEMPATPSTIYETAPEIIQTFSSSSSSSASAAAASPGDMN
jgi:hypothetical protein